MKLTKLEKEVLEIIKEYASELDMPTSEMLDIIKEKGIEKNVAKGVIGSLVKKGQVKMLEVNGEPTVWYEGGN